MTTAVTDTRAELNERAWEAIDSLIQTLGSTLNAREVAKRSLLTVTGQLLLRRAAFYVLNEDGDRLLLMESLGIRREHLGPAEIPLSERQISRLDSLDEIYEIEDEAGLPPELIDRFDFGARIGEGDDTLGLLLLGGKLGKQDFDSLDRRLLHTMGMVIGTTLQRSLSHQQMVEAKRRSEAIQSLQQQIFDHVTHEFNTPLTVIKSSAEFIRDGDEAARNEWSVMHAEALERLENLVRSIVEAGSATFTDGLMESRTQAQIIDLVMNPLVESSSWQDELVVQCHQTVESYSCAVDLGGMRTALDSLLQNAWRFSAPSRRRLALLSRAVHRGEWMAQDHRARLAAFSDCDEENLRHAGVEPIIAPSQDSRRDDVTPSHLVIEIMDAGLGIPAGERSTVFEPFAQASNSPYRHISGTGMGLMVARARIEEMHGEIRLVSTESVGSLFAILLPLHRTEPTPTR
jgi:signal transduction histidine kinase